MIYLDHHATTPVDPRVFSAMRPYLEAKFGNASSASHQLGREAADAVARAREQIAQAVGAGSDDVVLTSGATESINLAVQGACRAAGGGRKRLITVATEHSAVLQTCEAMAELGFETVVLPVQADGLLDLAVLRDALATPTLLVAVMAVNNELGVIQPIQEIAALSHEAGALLLCDGAQAPGRVALALRRWQVDLCSITAHKCYGPKGVGALIVRRGTQLRPLLYGGGQERGLRPGTTAVPMVVALGACMALAAAEQAEDERRLRGLRDGLLARLQDNIEGLVVNGSLSARVGGNLNVSIPAVSAATLMVALPDLAFSAGSACASGTPKPSHVLRALGLADEAALSSIRLGLGRGTTPQEVDDAGSQLIAEVSRIRAASPLWALRQAGVQLRW